MNSGIIFNITGNDIALYAGICSATSLSVLGCLAIIVTYRTFEELRRHPYTIVYRIAGYDLVTSVGLIVVYLLEYLVMLGILAGEAIEVILYLLWMVVTFGEFGSLCFHGLLSVSMIVNSLAPFSDGSSLTKFFKPIYAFCIIYPICRLIFWRLIHYGSLELSRKSELPWEGAIGITGAFLLNVTALIMSSCSVKSLTSKLYKTKRLIMFQLVLYLLIFVFLYSGPLIFRIEYLLDKSSVSSSNPLYIWSEISALIIGFCNSVVWMSMPVVRSAIKKRFIRSENQVPLVSNVDGDLGQLSRLLRKNILFSTVQGIRSVVRLYGEIGTDQLIDISEDDYVINSINTEITKHDEQYALEDEDLMFGTQIQFCSLAPKPFLNICKSSGFSTDYLNEILQPSKFLQDALKNQKFSEGKSGSFFVFSPDKKLIIKTIPEHEFSSMKHLIKDYYEHLMKNPDSLLIRLLGAFSLTFVHTKVYIIFMANLFTMPVHEKYDLKGSWVARTASESSSVKKDNDFTSTILMDAEHAKFFVNQIRADTAVLCKHNIMDYSLLLGVIPRNKKDNNKKLKNSSAISLEDLSTRDEENVDLESEPERTSPLPRTTFTSPDGELSYVISIIDILQTYNLDKRMERITKVYALCKDKQGLSVQEPEVYRSRFVEKMSQHIQIQKYL